MIQENAQKQIIAIWTDYIANNKTYDTKGNHVDEIDSKRFIAIKTLKVIIEDFLSNEIDLAEFKTDIDSFNKQNNYWGFTAIKGQMFFNLLLKTSESEEQTKRLTSLLKECITEPKDLTDALNKITLLDKYASNIFKNVPDKRKAPNPGSICYFLSYFWQVHNFKSWPIMYSSIIVSFTDLGLWSDPPTPSDAYYSFYNLNEEIKHILSTHSQRSITNWDAEHAFWNFRTITPYPKVVPKENVVERSDEKVITAFREASFNIFEYLPPITAKLIELGCQTEISSSLKGVTYEKTVVEVFKQLGFTEVLHLGQGKGSEPDIIIKYRLDGAAFIIDAKGYSNGYSLNVGDDRAIRDYISSHCAKLYNEGIRKIGFIIVSNSFKADLDGFINDLTWNTDIKRFKLITSEALLHLLAYKLKGGLQMQDIIDALISFGNIISKTDIIQKFDDI